MDGPRRIADRYLLDRLVGRGGMAEVWRAHDESLDRVVAVKLMRTQLIEDATFLERFRREARAAAGLNHPHIVAVHDTGDDHGLPYIVMEYVPGRSFADALVVGDLDRVQRLQVVAEAARALSVAHERGIVHRDVKPANILLTEQGIAKVTDFGIARAIGTDTITVTSVLGTAAYVSPEQARGENVDARSDVYALGVVLYEAVCGDPPFHGASPVQVALKHVGASPPRPGEATDDVDADLEAIILTALAKQRDRRYASARDLETDLVAYLAGDPVSVELATAVSASAGLGDQAVTGELAALVAPAEADDRRDEVAAAAMGAGGAPGGLGSGWGEAVRGSASDVDPWGVRLLHRLLPPDEDPRARRDRLRPYLAVGALAVAGLILVLAIG